MGIEQRLARVERHCRMYRNFLVLLALGGLAFVSIGLSQGKKEISDVVRTRRLEIINKNDKVVGSFFTGFQGGGALILRKNDSSNAVTLDSNLHAGGTIILFNDWREPAIQMHPDIQGDGLLMIKARGHQNRAYYTARGMQRKRPHR